MSRTKKFRNRNSEDDTRKDIYRKHKNLKYDKDANFRKTERMSFGYWPIKYPNYNFSVVKNHLFTLVGKSFEQIRHIVFARYKQDIPVKYLDRWLHGFLSPRSPWMKPYSCVKFKNGILVRRKGRNDWDWNASRNQNSDPDSSDVSICKYSNNRS